MSDFTNIEACVFDAYGTLFDFNSATARCRDALGDKADALGALWRRKQLEYTWLRSLMNRHADFWTVTADALDYAMAAVGLDDPALRTRLMELYLSLEAYPDAVAALRTLNDNGVKCAILSNGSPTMLVAAVRSAQIHDLLVKTISVEGCAIFKPHPSVYQLAVDALKVAPERIAFQSANGWDAAGAAAFGFRVAWINRFGQPREMLPAEPDAELTSLAGLPALLGLEPAD
jgi:2-haloacid dehalogenase